jgi:hypothetical protein
MTGIKYHVINLKNKIKIEEVKLSLKAVLTRKTLFGSMPSGRKYTITFV